MKPIHYSLLVLSSFLLTFVCGEDFTTQLSFSYFIEVFLPQGFKISLQHTEGQTLFAINININKNIGILENGEISGIVESKQNNRWVYVNKHIRLRLGDKLYFWIYRVINGIGSRADNMAYTVKYFEDSKLTDVQPSLTGVQTCQRGSTVVFGKPTCRDQVIYFEQFNDIAIPGGTINNWVTEIHIPRTLDSFFTILDNKNVKVENGQLIIEPTLTEDTYGEGFLTTGHLTLQGCTSEIKANCETTGFAWNIVPPILSSRVNTKDSFSFKYGIVEVRAKLPQGDWIVPEIWLIGRNEGPMATKVVVAKGFGNSNLLLNGKNIGGQRLAQGVSRNNKHSPFFFATIANLWSDDYHVYKIDWKPDQIRFLVDNMEIWSLSPSVINNECYISIGVHVGGLEDFPDYSISRGNNKPWRNEEIRNSVNFWKAKNTWYPSWNNNSRLLIDYIKVIAV